MVKIAEDRAWTSSFRQAVRWVGEYPLRCAAVFFMFTFILRMFCSIRFGPTIMISFYPDEWKYLHLAKSIAEGGPLLVQGAPAYFQKIMYPLVISPAFLFAQDPTEQIRIVGVINCLVMASVVFPTVLLTKRLTPKPAVLLLTLAFTCALPDFMYTISFMSETIYLPICIWVLYFFHRAMDEKETRKGLLWFALFGFFSWLAYLTKEVGAAFLIAGAALLFYEGLRNKRHFQRNGLALLVSAAAFFAPFIAVKQALFASVGNSYNGNLNGYDQIGLSALKSLDGMRYLLFSAAATFGVAIFSFYILPVLLPLFQFRKMNEKKQRMFLFTMLSLVIIVGAIAYTVSIREDMEYRVPRLHLRMFAPLAIPLAILCFDLLLSKDSKKKTNRQQTILVLTAVLCTLIPVLLPVVPAKDDWFDHASLTFSFLVKMLNYAGMGEAANSVWFGYTLFMLAIAAVGVICFILKKKKASFIILLCTISAMSAMDNFMCYRITEMNKQSSGVYYHVMDAVSKREPERNLLSVIDVLSAGKESQAISPLVEAALSTDKFLRENIDFQNSDVVVCVNDAFFSTYASQHLRLTMVSPTMISEYKASGHDRVDVDRVNPAYIVVGQDFNPFRNVEVIFSHAPYLVLRNLDPSLLYY